MVGLELELEQTTHIFLKTIKDQEGKCGRLKHYLANVYSSPPPTSMETVFFSVLMILALVLGFALANGMGTETFLVHCMYLLTPLKLLTTTK